MLQQQTADALALVFREHIGMPDKRHVLHCLNPHHTGELRIGPFRAPKGHTIRNLMRQLRRLHVGIMPTIGGNHPAVAGCSVVNDRENHLLLIQPATANRWHERLGKGSTHAFCDLYGIAEVIVTRRLGEPDEKEPAYRQPRAGATCVRIDSSTCALYSTPSVFGTVRSSVSASAMASSPLSSSINTSGSAA